MYITFVGLWERFENYFWANFYRKENWAPVWILDEPVEKNTIYQVNFEAKNITGKEMILNSNEWLNLWGKSDITKVISFSKSLSYLYRNFLPDALFDLKTISNQKEYLETFLNAKISVEFEDNESSFWDKLLEEITSWDVKNLNLESIFLKHFNLNSLENLEIENYLKLYMEYKDSFDRWLLKNFLLQHEKVKNSYLVNIFIKRHHFDKKTLLDLVWFEIFEGDPKEDFFAERKMLLKILHKDLKEPLGSIESKIGEKLDPLNELTTKEKLKYLTSISFAEKRHIVKMLKGSSNFSEDLELVKAIYPELYYYLSWDNLLLSYELEPWMLEYFKNYNISKMINKKSKNLEDILNEKNKDKDSFCKWYYKIEKSPIEEKNQIWIDGLGAEWIPLVIYLIEEYGRSDGKFIEKKLITRVNLPTVTECNRHETKKIGVLDKYIHNENPYSYPDDLINEIEIVKSIIKEISESNFEKLSIVSDHGFTFLSQKQFDNIKKLDLEAHHDGRCMWIGKNAVYHNDEYFIVWNTENGSCQDRESLVALKHISLQNVPKREVHGGATPEEVLVPYITISTEKKHLEYEIKPSKFEVSIKVPVIEFAVYPEPRYTPKLKFRDKIYEVRYDKKSSAFKVNLHGLRIGMHNLDLEIGDKKYEIEVEIKGGFKESDLL